MNTTSFALITGASAGIGKATAYILAKEKKPLILVARRKNRLEDIKRQLTQAFGIEVMIFDTDLTDTKKREKLFSQLKSISIDVVINNAGCALGTQALQEYAADDIDSMIDLNIKAAIHVARLSLPHLIETKGHIVQLSSVAGIEAYEGGTVYCSTKAFMRMASKGMRIDVHGTGVRVTDIAPGKVETEFSLVRYQGDEKKAHAGYVGYTPLYAEDIAEAILFALTRPAHVNIDYMQIMPTDQASATRIAKT